jgi:hypothetical protein
MKRTPVFPVVAIDPRGSFIGLPSAKYLETASPTALRNGYFERLYLYDSAGEALIHRRGHSHVRATA